MPLTKQPVEINFGQGLDTKTDPFQVQLGKFLKLTNTVFGSGGSLVKRAGFPLLTKLGNAEQTTLLNYNNNLLATGSSLYAYSPDSDQWLNQGSVQPVTLDVKPLFRNSYSQSQVDSAIAANNLLCTVYKEGSDYYYQINDSVTGQVIVERVTIAGVNPKVVTLGNNFIITFVTATPLLRYIAVPIYNPNSPSAAATIASTIAASTSTYDVFMNNERAYIAWNASDVGGAIRIAYLSSSLVVSSAVALATYSCNLLSLFSDDVNLWLAWWDSTSNILRYAVRDPNLSALLAPTTVTTNSGINQINACAKNATAIISYQITTNYSYVSVRSDAIKHRTATIAGAVSSEITTVLGAGIASKAFYDDNGMAYYLIVYQSDLQPTYFLIDTNGNIIMKLAQGTAASYISSFVLPSITKLNNSYYSAYLFKTALVPVNKNTGSATSVPFYSQIGVNLATFDINQSGQFNAEIAQSINLTGGITWMYDSVQPVELGFNVYPEQLKTTPSTTGGSMSSQAYYYAATYEWTDAQGKLQRSAPSVPLIATIASGTAGSVVVDIPMLRLTYKTSVRIVLYRYSVAQPIYYQITSITTPIISDPTLNSYQYTDTQADASIAGNPILYTTGGVLENIAPPSFSAITLFKSRMVGVDSNNKNLLWYSKQVLQDTPLEFSDFQTIYVPATIGNNQSSTGSISALCAMDDKLLAFKPNSIFYVTGNGPDATGANNDFSEPTFITSTVGCDNQSSLVLTPLGIMFQSNKGIWLLGRDLSTKYIGADVEAYNDAKVLSALLIPNTNQVVFVLDSGKSLCYDYYYGQWSEWAGFKPLSATLYNESMTCLDTYGNVTIQTPDVYNDNGKPVLLSFTTNWIKLAGLQGYQRAYFLYLLGVYKSPHKLSVNVAFDYSSTAPQTVAIYPTNAYTVYGDEPLYGNGEFYGGTDGIENWRVFFDRQKCQSIQLQVSEQFDTSYGTAPGEGLTLSGLNVVVGVKDAKPKLKAANSAG